MRGQGLSSNGTIDPDPGTVMWFKGYERVRPGKVGTAVIAAHVATGKRPDVFADLADVKVGDTVEVFEGGKTVKYRVTRAGAIDKKKVTTDQTVWGENTSRTRLAIITCDDAYGLQRAMDSMVASAELLASVPKAVAAHKSTRKR